MVRLRDPSGTVILDVGGVGYELAVSLQTLAAVPDLDQACSLWVHTHVREDQLSVFGFASPLEKRLFRLLTSVPKVGPKAAMAVLGGFSAADLVRAIAEGDAGSLQRVPGIGRKTAEQITLTLGDKMGPLLSGTAGSGAAQRPEGVKDHEDAAGVLISLGWKPKQVERALEILVTDGRITPSTSLDEVVRETLASLMER